MDQRELSLEARIELRQALVKIETLANRRDSGQFIRNYVSPTDTEYHRSFEIHISFSDNPTVNLSNIIDQFEKHSYLGGFLKAVLDNLCQDIDATIIKTITNSYEYVMGVQKFSYIITEEPE